MKIIFVRHGETDTNLLEKQGKAILENDAPLNEIIRNLFLLFAILLNPSLV